MKIMKQTTILFLSVVLFCVAGTTNEARGADQQGGKPNVLFIAIDDLNDWTDILNGNRQAKTPHMDKLASQGMLFTNAHCAAPACGPSRAAIMSGISPATSGNYVNQASIKNNPILNNAVLMPEFFQQNGYYTAGTGKLFHGAHHITEMKGRGFDEYYPSKTQDRPSTMYKFSKPGHPQSGLKMGRAVDWGPFHPEVSLEDTGDGKVANWAEEKLLGGDLKEPFFLGTGIYKPHMPFYAPQKYFDRFPLDEIELPQGYLENDMDDVPEASSKQRHAGYATEALPAEAGRFGDFVNSGLKSSAHEGVTRKLSPPSSGSVPSWLRMYSMIASSVTLPLEATK